MENRQPDERRDICKTNRIKNIIFAVVVVVLSALIIFVLYSRINGKSPSFFGYSLYRVSSDSMKPNLITGDIILCGPCDPMTLKEGDIITYRGAVGELADRDVTHRVIRAPYEADGLYCLVTKGDDNPAEDSPIKLSQVEGKFISRLDAFKSVYNFFLTPWGLIVMLALILLAFSREIAASVRLLRRSIKANHKDLSE